jgi:hypothetical protein
MSLLLMELHSPLLAVNQRYQTAGILSSELFQATPQNIGMSIPQEFQRQDKVVTVWKSCQLAIIMRELSL